MADLLGSLVGGRRWKTLHSDEVSERGGHACEQCCVRKLHLNALPTQHEVDWKLTISWLQKSRVF